MLFVVKKLFCSLTFSPKSVGLMPQTFALCDELKTKHKSRFPCTSFYFLLLGQSFLSGLLRPKWFNTISFYDDGISLNFHPLEMKLESQIHGWSIT